MRKLALVPLFLIFSCGGQDETLPGQAPADHIYNSDQPGGGVPHNMGNGGNQYGMSIPIQMGDPNCQFSKCDTPEKKTDEEYQAPPPTNIGVSAPASSEDPNPGYDPIESKIEWEREQHKIMEDKIYWGRHAKHEQFEAEPESEGWHYGSSSSEH